MKKITLHKDLLAMFYPRLCVGCGEPLLQGEELFCTHCMLHLPETNYYREPDNALKMIFAGRVPVREVACFLHYKKDTITQHAIHALKYQGQKEVGRHLGYLLGQALIQEERFQSVELILPIPLHPKKQKKRGYNQSEWIAKGLSESMGRPYATDVLVRSTFTETQTHKARFNRWENVKEVFALQRREQVAGKHLLVCDDVLTTGATMEAAIQHLIAIKDVTVSVATLASATH